MRRLSTLVIVAACGGGSDPVAPDVAAIDARPSNCQAIPAQGQFIRRQGNPRLLAGTTFTDGKVDQSISDPDVFFDEAAARFELYYAANHEGITVIRHASSVDRMTWTVDDAPVLAPSTDAAAWDLFFDAPTVIVNPAAPADRRYLMLYAGAKGVFPHDGFTIPDYAIGAAFSADGITFTRVTAAQSPHGQEGLVLTGAQAYPGANDATVSEPELALVDGIYHVWFSSFACEGAMCDTPTDFGIAHATSADGITWTIAEAPVRSLLRASADDLSGGRSPSVIHDAAHCRFEMWLANDQFGDVANQPVDLDNVVGVWKAESNDGLSWSVFYTGQREVAWNPTSPAAGEKLGLRAGADVALQAGGRLMLHIGFDDQNVPAGFTLPGRTGGPRPGVMTMNVATRDLP